MPMMPGMHMPGMPMPAGFPPPQFMPQQPMPGEREMTFLLQCNEVEREMIS